MQTLGISEHLLLRLHRQTPANFLKDLRTLCEQDIPTNTIHIEVHCWEFQLHKVESTGKSSMENGSQGAAGQRTTGGAE